LRIAFAGTPEFAAHILSGLIRSPQELIGVVTRPDRPAGRGRRSTASAVKRIADRAALPMITPSTLRDPDVPNILNAWAPDALVVVAYGLILPPQVLSIPRHGCINAHASLLPRWRGAAPIERAILAGDQETGVSIMRMDEGLDSGPVFRTSSCPIDSEDTGDSLAQKLADLGLAALLEVLADIESGRARATPQDDSKATYATKLSSEDAVIRWERSASDVCRQVRALFSRMPAVSWLDGVRVRVLAADVGSGAGKPGTLLATDHGITVACGQGSLHVRELQLSRGKGRPMSARAALNGYPNLFRPGAQFDAEH
jgi:methionyl-tRNA formyltransferase